MTAAKGVQFQSAELDDMIARARATPDSYAAEVLRSDLLSVGLYIVPAGGNDDQSPHGEDEVYYAVRGRAKIRVGEQDHLVRPGTVLFVPARAVHYFHDITEELILVVFWAPPEKSVDQSKENA
ncbi:MAG TPA: cupin domain-containing protein [Candidatus Dormibacteraeota bacterium]|nr:cupin domain-containing protein [Candidatus Dormibacteraeota bacterium]